MRKGYHTTRHRLTIRGCAAWFAPRLSCGSRGRCGPACAATAALAGSPIRVRQAVARQLDHRRAQRLGWERHGAGTHVAELCHLGRAPVHEVERDPRAEAAGADAEARVADGIGEAAAEVRAEEHREAGAGVDRAAPAVGETDAGQLREGREEVLRQLPKGPLVVIELGADRPTVAVDRVVAAPQDPVIGGHPVVVELVAAVGDPVPPAPADRRRAAPRSAARSPARSRTRARCSGAGSAAAVDRPRSRAERAALARCRRRSAARVGSRASVTSRTRVDSKIRAPAVTARARSPSTRRAGFTSASPDVTRRPPR